MPTESSYLYTIESTLSGSERFGNCDVCGKYAEDIFKQVESNTKRPHLTSTLYGHKACLESQQR